MVMVVVVAAAPPPGKPVQGEGSVLMRADTEGHDVGLL